MRAHAAGVSPLALSIGSFVMGVISLALAVSTSRSTGPGSGFKGYTTGFRIRLWLTYALGVVLLVQGVVLLRIHRALQSRPPVQSTGK
jgi:hypothetical protein